MLNISEREGEELVRGRVGRGQGLTLTLDLNSNWVSHGTLASDKQVNIFVKCLSWIFVKYLEYLQKSGCVGGVGWTAGLSLSQSLKSACRPWQRNLGRGEAKNPKYNHEKFRKTSNNFFWQKIKSTIIKTYSKQVSLTGLGFIKPIYMQAKVLPLSWTIHY